MGRFLGFWSTMIYAAFAYGNVQVVAIAGAETRNPRRSIPKALKRTFFRVVAFYVASIFVISLTVPANDERLRLTTGNASQSPFVIAFSRAGVKVSCSVHSTTKFLFLNKHLGSPIDHQRNCTVLSFSLFKQPGFLTLHVDPYISLQLRKFLHVFGFSNPSWTSPRWPCAVYIFEIKSISYTIRCSVCLSHLGCACISHLE
jgi:hypothetical protein